MTDTGPAPEEHHYRAIGRMTVAFSQLELEVAFLTWCLISEEQKLGQVITAELSFRSVITLLDAVFRYRIDDPQLVAEMKSLLGRIEHVENERNRLIHSAWMAGDTPSTRRRLKITAKRGRGLEHHFEQVDIDKIDNLAGNMESLAAEVMAFMSRLSDSVPGVHRA